ncbi:MAG: AI-2E family transporter, partial [Rhodobacteraceae bacterium]|nr:AI-2E family transporter [Paracoccaceae bacterium]
RSWEYRLLKDLPALRGGVLQILPRRLEPEVAALFSEMDVLVGRYLRGQMLVSLIVGGLTIAGAFDLLAQVTRRRRVPEARQIPVDLVQVPDRPAEDLARQVGNIDLVYEAVGEGHVTFDVMRVLGVNGIFILTGIPAMKPAIPVFADNIMRNVTLKNQAIIGTVNADTQAFTDAIRDLGEFQRRWPAAIAAVITGRFGIDSHRELLLDKARGIKNVIRFA